MAKGSKSKAGLVIAGLYLLLAAMSFAWVYFEATALEGVSVLSATVLLVFLAPWILLMPDAWITPPAAIACIVLNALILYMLFGGWRIASRR